MASRSMHPRTRGRTHVTHLVIRTVIAGVVVYGAVFVMRYLTERRALTDALREQAAAMRVPTYVPPVAQHSRAEKKSEKNILSDAQGATGGAATSTVSVPTGAFNIAVPFISQAPQKVWDAAHEDYCEEAAMLTLVSYYSHTTFMIDDQEAHLAAARDWEMNTFGYFESTNVAETVQMAQEFFKLKNVRVVENPTPELIRGALAQGHLVVLPTNGRLLFNPHFQNGGPEFHMVVVRGFTEVGDFITNDPGTQFGENYVYKKDVLMAAIHDWDHDAHSKTPASGAPRMIVVE